MKNFYKKQNKGFTLIEMIIAVFIFTVSLTALMTVSARGLRAANLAQKQVVADYLALEAIEAVRNLRDTELLDGDSVSAWSDLFDKNNCWSESMVSGSASGCGVLYNSSPFEIIVFPCNNGSDDCNMFYNESDFAYRQFVEGVPSGSYKEYAFTREIKFRTIPSNDDEIIITVVVAWDKGEVEYTENLFMWI
jgi:prepilin-type N-terminal cleavage/methylation domain-containing protein